MDSYEQRSKIERMALSQIIPILFEGKDYQSHFTDIQGSDIYDAYGMVFDPDTKSIKSRFIIEIKIRDNHYDKILLEYKKAQALFKKASITDAIVVYISTTPQGSFCFNLTKLIQQEEDYEWIYEEHWKTTVDKSQGKINKKLTYLDIKDGRKINITTNKVKNDIIDIEKEIILSKALGENKKQFCLYRDVLKPGEE